MCIFYQDLDVSFYLIKEERERERERENCNNVGAEAIETISEHKSLCPLSNVSKAYGNISKD